MSVGAMAEDAAVSMVGGGRRQWLYVARVGAAFGVRGGVFMLLGDFSPDMWHRGPEVVRLVSELESKEFLRGWKGFADLSDAAYQDLVARHREYAVLSWQVKPGSSHRVRVLLQGVEGRDQAQALRGCCVLVRRQDLVGRVGTGAGTAGKEHAEQGVFWSDFYGKAVAREDRVLWGTVTDVYNHGASDVLQVRDVQGAVFEIPYIERYFPDPFALNGPLRCVCAQEELQEYQVSM